jgi:hypothetical protein
VVVRKQQRFRIQFVTFSSDAEMHLAKCGIPQFAMSHIKASGELYLKPDGSIEFEALLDRPFSGTLMEGINRLIRRHMFHFATLTRTRKRGKMAVLARTLAVDAWSTYEHWNPDRITFQFTEQNDKGHNVLYRVHASRRLKPVIAAVPVPARKRAS